jgi:hypothetical protein
MVTLQILTCMYFAYSNINMLRQFLLVNGSVLFLNPDEIKFI